MKRLIIRLFNSLNQRSETFRELVEETIADNDEYIHKDEASEYVSEGGPSHDWAELD